MIHNLVVDILPVIFMLVLFYKSKIQRPINSLNDDYLSLHETKCYRGVFAIGIVLHHLAQRCTYGYIFSIFAQIGLFITAFFFFLSGYGVQKSYILKQNDYKNGFLLKRIPPILIPYLFITIIYWLAYYFFNGYILSFQYLAEELIKGHPLIMISWYVVAILLFYMVYWLLMNICKKNYTLMIILAIIWIVFYTKICQKLQFGGWWYLSCHLLIIGMIWATYERQILVIIRKSYCLITPMIWITFILLTFFPQFFPFMDNPFLSNNKTYLTTVLFVLGILLFNMKVRIGNKMLTFFGEISLEIYLMQEFFISFLQKSYFYHSNELLWAFTVLVGTIISAWILHMGFQLILKKYREAI